MILLPIESPDHEHDMLVIVLDDTGLERMKGADPAQVTLRECGRELVNPTIYLCHEKPTPEFMRVINSGSLPKIMTFLQRGWEFRPDKGDHDRGFEKLSEGN